MSEPDAIDEIVHLERVYELVMEAGVLSMIASDLLKDAAHAYQTYPQYAPVQTAAIVDNMLHHANEAAARYRTLADEDETYEPIESFCNAAMRLAGAVKRILQVASSLTEHADDASGEPYAKQLFRELDRQHADLVAMRDSLE